MAGAVGTASGSSVWYKNAAGIKNQIRILLRRVLGREPDYDDMQTTKNSINEALQACCLDKGIERWKFLQRDYSLTFTANQNYIDLTSSNQELIDIVTGTMRIESEDVILYPSTLETLKVLDPDASGSGIPALYALDTSDNGAMYPRIYFDRAPTSAYTLDFVGAIIVDEDDTDAFPAWLTGPLTDLATAITFRRLGLAGGETYYAAYKDTKTNAKMAQGYDGPKHISRPSDLIYERGLESRTP